MRLSELVATCAAFNDEDLKDPLVTVEDRNGLPVDVEDAALGVVRRPDGSRTSYVVLATRADGDER